MLRTFARSTLFGSITGDGMPTVLALHGWGRTHHDFDAVLRPAGGTPLEALALDLPGFGATPPPTEAWGSAEYAARVAGVLDDMAGSVVVLGHSFGGKVAVQLAASHPQRVRGLVLVGVPLLRTAPPKQPALIYRLVRTLHRAGVVGEDRMEEARRRYGSADYRAAQGIMRQVLTRTVGETYEAQLDALDCPVELVWGSDDATVPLSVAEAAAARLAWATVTVCPEAGHLVPLTAPDVVRAATERCLACLG